MKRFKYLGTNNLFKKLKTLNENIKQINFEELIQESINRNPYQVFFDWLLEIVVFGILATIVYNVFIGWQGYMNFALVPALGIIRWLWIEIVKQTSKSIRGKNA